MLHVRRKEIKLRADAINSTSVLAGPTRQKEPTMRILENAISSALMIAVLALVAEVVAL
jgi:hypothetical protein